MNFIPTLTFEKQIRRLSRRYPQIRDDLKGFKSDFIRGIGRGDKIPGLKWNVYKARMKSTDMRRGKRGGFRIIYYLQTLKDVILLTIYPKVKKEDISNEEIQRILMLFFQQNT